ncbi:hypothetical protein KIPB_002466 [Kipferlia bialata]|uniref:Uncharacterized protein n=1 Tax=Kipferlia bialata TaxID=797122 RepID=A0A9K3CRS9_9EUKA|nr:hypothetical protein KIPB_002466 [Kipferlia bialata]|eukprot:g2466.t1
MVKTNTLAVELSYHFSCMIQTLQTVAADLIDIALDIVVLLVGVSAPAAMRVIRSLLSVDPTCVRSVVVGLLGHAAALRLGGEPNALSVAACLLATCCHEGETGRERETDSVFVRAEGVDDKVYAAIERQVFADETSLSSLSRAILLKDNPEAEGEAEAEGEENTSAPAPLPRLSSSSQDDIAPLSPDVTAPIRIWQEERLGMNMSLCEDPIEM